MYMRASSGLASVHFIIHQFFNLWVKCYFEKLINIMWRIHQRFCSQIKEIHINGPLMPNYGVTMAHWLIHWWWALASVLDCCYDRGRKNCFEAALRPLCAFWRGAWYSDRNLLSILNSEFACVCALTKESHVMYHETVIIF